MAGLLDAFRQYARDAMPGGALNPEVTRQGLLDGAAVATMPVPLVGDAVGLLADANRFASDPSSRTPLNFGMSALGLLPLVPGMTAMKKAEEVKGLLSAKHPNVRFKLRDGDNGLLELVTVEVPKNMRGQGLGDAFMHDLTRIADAEGMTLKLRPSNELGGNVGKLKSWYRGMGFEPSTGKPNMTEMINEQREMFRRPRKD